MGAIRYDLVCGHLRLPLCILLHVLRILPFKIIYSCEIKYARYSARGVWNSSGREPNKRRRLGALKNDRKFNKIA